MREKVKRYVMRTSGHGGVMPVNENYAGRDRQYVLASDYTALTAERDLLLEAPEESQSLLASLLHEQRPENEIEEQIIENRWAIDHAKGVL